MGAISETLRHDLAQPELSEGYAEAFQGAYLATQMKVLREENGWTQAELAEKLNTTQTVISRIENVNYSAWNISTLRKIARAFRLRLHVSFETYGSLIGEMSRFSRENLKRKPREQDPYLNNDGTLPERKPPASEVIQTASGMGAYKDISNNRNTGDAKVQEGTKAPNILTMPPPSLPPIVLRPNLGQGTGALRA